jgi:hypothetical protein
MYSWQIKNTYILMVLIIGVWMLLVLGVDEAVVII